MKGTLEETEEREMGGFDQNKIYSRMKEKIE